MALLPTPRGNQLLAQLPVAEWTAWQGELEDIELPQGLVLHEAGGPMAHAYFPTTAIVSLLQVMESGASAEIAVVGHDGVVGIALFMGGETAPNCAVVQSSGRALRLSACVLQDTFNRGGVVMQLLLRYTQSLIAQLAQTAACNRHHALEQQLCRWLLSRLDRLPGNELAMTQEMMANLLGVRREGVTEAALKLQSLGIIRYARGHITVLDRSGLVQRSCECYAAVNQEYRRLLPPLFG